MTTNAIRDLLLEVPPLGGDGIHSIKKWALEEEDRRKNDPAFVKCPRCYGRHHIHGNHDDLCDSCIQIILKHFPDHPSAPHIKAAFAKWKTRDQKREEAQRNV